MYIKISMECKKLRFFFCYWYKLYISSKFKYKNNTASPCLYFKY